MISDLLMHIAASNREEQDRWEHTRQIMYTVAKFGNSDPKSFPSSVKRFLKFDWDEEGSEEDDLIRFAREYKKKKNGG